MTTPRRNRVDPFGRIVAVADHGDLMGNRGCLHDDAGTIVRNHKGTAWVSCLTRWPGVRQTLMAPRHYTQLFFRDEATALAAGHRPCHDCQRAKARMFGHAWVAAHGGSGRVGEIDAMLHRERLGPRRAFDGGALPDGAMVGRADATAAWLALAGGFRQWSFAGYAPDAAPDGDLVLLTPPSIVATLAAGYRPALHASAAAAG